MTFEASSTRSPLLKNPAVAMYCVRYSIPYLCAFCSKRNDLSTFRQRKFQDSARKHSLYSRICRKQRPSFYLERRLAQGEPTSSISLKPSRAARRAVGTYPLKENAHRRLPLCSVIVRISGTVLIAKSYAGMIQGPPNHAARHLQSIYVNAFPKKSSPLLHEFSVNAAGS